MADLIGIVDLVETRDVLAKTSNVGDPSASKRGVGARAAAKSFLTARFGIRHALIHPHGQKKGCEFTRYDKMLLFVFSRERVSSYKKQCFAYYVLLF
jgi:hypothetical protein